MISFTPKNILLYLIDFPEFLLRSSLVILKVIFFPNHRREGKIRTISQNAIIIESKHKGLKIISIEVMDGFSVYHGVHKKVISQASREKIKTDISSKLSNQNVYVSLEGGDPRLLKVVIQN